MSGKNQNKNSSSGVDDDAFDENLEYDDLELLERLESLRENMEDLGVTTITEVIQRITELHQQLDKRQ
jgi:hypothetical protein